jgi:virginiamycin B lyase
MKPPQKFWSAILCLATIPGLLLSAQSQLPEGEGKDLVETVCTQCHGLESTTDARYTLDEWRNVVYDMVSEGAPLLDDEVEIIAQYLAKNYGSGSSSSPSKDSAQKYRNTE